MPAPRHNIGRLTAEVLVPGGDAFNAQNKASAFIRQNVLPLVEKVFDKVGAGKKIIRLQKLELDFGAFNPEHDNHENLLRFEQMLEDKMLNLIAGNKQPGDEETEELNHEQSNEELFLFLLSKGHAPWWLPPSGKAELKELAAAALQAPTPQFLQALRQTLYAHNARQRLTRSLPIDLIQKIMQLLRLDAPEQWLNTLMGAVSGSHKEELLRLLYRALLNPGFDAKSLGTLAKKIAAENKSQLLPETILKELNEPNEEPQAEEPETDEDAYYLKNAGLVLLAPMLPHYFKVLGLTDEKNKFVSPKAQEKALCLVQHLATGQEENFQEHELVFCKLLCGMPLLMPLSENHIISETEKEESMELLKAVVQNWTALKNTSPEGMRDAFVSRAGILKRQANGWNLKIERQTIDILIDRLPWGISVIKTAWNEEVIFVDWT